MTSRTRTPRSAETRRRIELAAAELLAARGYGATTLQAIADAAAVHVQTIYLSYGTKAAVLAAAGARLVAGEDDPESHPSTRAWSRAIAAEPDAARKLERYVDHIAEVSMRITRLLDALRATAPAEPEAAAFLEQMEAGRREGPRQLLGPLAGSPELRPGLDPDTIADIVFTLASPDTLRALVERCGWPPDRACRWITATLAGELLPGTPADPAVP